MEDTLNPEDRPTYTFQPIGWVENEFEEPKEPDFFQGTESLIRIKPEFEEGLYRLEKYSRLYVIYVFHLSSGYSLLVYPRGDLSRPERGVFATCSPRQSSDRQQMGSDHFCCRTSLNGKWLLYMFPIVRSGV